MADVAASQLGKMSLASNDSTTSKPTLLDKRAPGTAGRALELNTNITPITLAPNMTYYKYDIRIYAIFDKKRDGSECLKEFAKQTRDDYNEQERKKACSEIFMHLVNTERLFQGDMIYDRAAILFSTQKLEGVTPEKEVKFVLPPEVQTVCSDAKAVGIIVKQAVGGFSVSSNDLVKSVNADFKKDHCKELLEVLNLATSQTPFFSPRNYITYGNGNIYLLDPGSFGFQSSEAPAIGKDKFTGIGLSKGVKILEGNNKPGGKDYMPALVLDVKKTAFHNFDECLTDKIMSMYGGKINNANLTRDLRDLRCLTMHKKASIIIGGFTIGPVGKSTFKDKEGNVMQVVDYYEKKYKIKIARPDLPGVIDRSQRNIYPTDLLRVAPMQRVKTATREVVDALIKVSAIKPELRWMQTVNLSKLLNLGGDKAMHLGVYVPNGQESLVVPARVLPNIALLAAQGGMNGPSWRGANKFVVGAKIEKWAAFLFFASNAGRSRFNPEETFQGFVQKLTDAGNRKGMQIAQPSVVERFDVPTGHVDPIVTQALKKASEAGCTYVLVVSDERMKTHEPLKAEETKFKVTTQEVTLTRAAQVVFENKTQTLENIIMKTNVKMKGMNHVIHKDHGLHHTTDAIIMGIFIQQPRGMTAAEIAGGVRPSYPAMIGLSANNAEIKSEHPQQREMAGQQYFTTAYKYAHPKEWKKDGETQLETMTKMIADAIKLYKENRGRIPSKVVIYRGGISEGQLPYVASAERDAIQAAFRSLAADYKPTLVLIAASKEHNERFYHKVFPSAPQGSRVDTNLPAGVVVDKMAVNPELNEFYLQSHKALQGTAKATKYTLLLESSGRLTQDQIQHMTYALCHVHEIVNSTTAVPTPLYVAEESAKRAVNVYHHIMGAADSYDLEELNKMAPSALGSRINA